MDIVLKGYITESGELKIELPVGLPVGEVQVSIQVTAPEPPTDETWTEAELEDLPNFKAKTGAEIIAFLEETDGWWHDDSITDGQAWVEEQRRKAAERRKLPEW